MTGMEAADGHHVDFDTEQLARLGSERPDREQPGAGRAGDQDVQVAAGTVRAARRRAEDTDIVEAGSAREAQKIGTARSERIMRQRPHDLLQAFGHVMRSPATR